MIEKLKKTSLMQIAILTFLIVNVSISFTAFHFLQGISYLVWSICCLSFAVLSVLSIRKPVITYLDACVITYLTMLMVFTIINGTDIK